MCLLKDLCIVLREEVTLGSTSLTRATVKVLSNDHVVQQKMLTVKTFPVVHIDRRAYVGRLPIKIVTLIFW